MPRDTRSERPVLDPHLVATQAFSTSFRGFDPTEVRGYLEALAGLLHDAAVREADLFRRLAEAEQRAANPPPLDEHQLTVLLGEETARVLEAARRAATEIRSKAEENAGRLVLDASVEATTARSAAEQYAAEVRSEAEEHAARVRSEAEEHAAQVRQDADQELSAQRSGAQELAEKMRADAEAEAIRVRGEAESVLALRTKEAEDTAATIVSEAEEMRAAAAADAEARRDQAAAEVEDMRARASAEAAAAVEAARQEGRSMVVEARAVRERMLANLTERRRVARAQLDQLRVTRAELLSALDAVRAQIDAAAHDIAAALPSVDGATAATARRDADDDETMAAMLAGPVAAGDVAEDAPPVAPEAKFGGKVSVDPETPIDEAVGASGEVPDNEATTGALGGAPDGDASPAEGRRGIVEVGQEVAAGGGATVPVGPSEAPFTGPSDPVASHAGRGADIDSLFAKMRAAREQTVAEARSVLGDDLAVEGPGSAPTEPPPGLDVAAADVAAADVAAANEPVSAEANGHASGEPISADGNVLATASGHDADGAIASLLDRRDGATEEIERRLSRRLKRILSDEQNEMLDLVRRTRGRPAADELLPDQATHARRYTEAASEDLGGAVAAGGQFFGNAAGSITTQVDDIAGELAGELVGQLRGRLERCFEDAQGDEAELDERIRACYREWKTQRIADTSRHFVLRAFTRGLFDATPGGSCFRWIVDDGGTPCPDAEDNALGGEVLKGEPFPTGDVHPPAHPGCRCLIVPCGPDGAQAVVSAPGA